MCINEKLSRFFAFISVYLKDNVVLSDEGGLGESRPQRGMAFNELGTQLVMRVAEYVQFELLGLQCLQTSLLQQACYFIRAIFRNKKNTRKFRHFNFARSGISLKESYQLIWPKN
jgi:hypothetical protein